MKKTAALRIQITYYPRTEVSYVYIRGDYKGTKIRCTSLKEIGEATDFLWTLYAGKEPDWITQSQVVLEAIHRNLGR